MNSAVLDASVAAKWFLPPEDEDLVAEALALYREYQAGRVEFIVPDIFWAEMGNIAWKAVRRKRWTAQLAIEALRDARALHMATLSSHRLIEAAFSIAVESGASVYDALYVALAEQARLGFVTADQRLVNTLGARFPVRWLGAHV